MHNTLIITNKQLDAFSASLLKSFYADSEMYLRTKFPLSTSEFSSLELRNIIENGIEKASCYNIIERIDVIIFLEYIVFMGNDFDADPSNDWASDILGIRNLSGSEKIKRMLRTYPLTAKS